MDKDNFLGRWIAGDLSEEEREAFENSKDHLAYKDIIRGVDKFQQPIFDVEKNFKEQLKYNQTYKGSSTTKVIKLKTWLYSAAAVILVLIGIKTVYFTSIDIHTSMAETKVWTLPDNSLVTLNADSSIEYDKDSFLKDRVIQLNGEAFFDVAKGSKFTVKTDQGNIIVLGTEFNVFTRDHFLEVYCFEGKVQVNNNKNASIVLTPGKGVKSSDKGALLPLDIKGKKPTWLNGKSSFKQVTLLQLIAELERQYDININTNNIDVKRIFTGFFVHNDLEKALKTCFEPMNINYVFKNTKNIELKNK
ncbi:FecR family protein [Aquimarina sp. RZ0]|uniref:FecR family protein n=1 Tax=Aquimarina sp. RZ0 TaxID=2607730 RepID=UPI0021028297|nr:FecR family protein [Aquimarina sp. RZ0]